MKTVFVNPELCIGCRQCEFACVVEHSKSRDPFLALFEDPPPRSRIHVEPGPVMNTSFPNRCRHCSPAPCQRLCPTGAVSRDTAHDIVLVDPGKCIACAMCAMVCPFDVITFHPMADGAAPHVAATKCDGCIERVRRDEVPACVEVCKVGALVFGELNELMAEGRAGETAKTLAAMALVGGPEEPDPIAGWRAWGTEAAQVAGSV